MSEYQYYEFRTIKRQLTSAERAAVNKFSSHGHTTGTSYKLYSSICPLSLLHLDSRDMIK